jgi:hypothetical protein
MNIKGLNSSPVLSIDSKARIESKTRAQSSADRDADGRSPQDGGEEKRHLKQQEFDEALKALGEMPGLKSNHLSIKVEVKDDCRVILILDPDGQVVRRLSEHQLWLATRDKDRPTGKILDKAM